jgi:hypothetical protein
MRAGKLTLLALVPKALQLMQGGAIVLGCELHQGVCMNILAKPLMCYKVFADNRTSLQQGNYHYYRHITQGWPIHGYRFCSGTRFFEGALKRRLNPAEVQDGGTYLQADNNNAP